jgi:hypothetical protein
MKSIPAFMLICWFAGLGCASYQEHAAKRTARLREIYPQGMSKEAVQSRWQRIKSDFSASRPDNGWNTHPNQYIAKKVQSEEASTGKSIASVDRYWGPDGLWSLCYCWYFYDAAGKIVDVEWQYKSD